MDPLSRQIWLAGTRSKLYRICGGNGFCSGAGCGDKRLGLALNFVHQLSFAFDCSVDNMVDCWVHAKIGCFVGDFSFFSAVDKH